MPPARANANVTSGFNSRGTYGYLLRLVRKTGCGFLHRLALGLDTPVPLWRIRYRFSLLRYGTTDWHRADCDCVVLATRHLHLELHHQAGQDGANLRQSPDWHSPHKNRDWATHCWLPVTSIWNYIIKQGKTGQTFGKARIGIRLIRIETGQPIGAGYAFLRWFLAALLGSITGSIFTIIDLIFPAFDDKKQRVLDKMLSTVVVNNDAKPSSIVVPTTTGTPPSLYS